MSLLINSVKYGPQNNQMNTPQNNLLLYNTYNNLNQGKNDALYNNTLNNENKTTTLKKIYLTTNKNKSPINNNRKRSLDKDFYASKKNQTLNIDESSRAKRNLSSSGYLKPSKRLKFLFSKSLKLVMFLKNLKNIKLI